MKFILPSFQVRNSPRWPPNKCRRFEVALLCMVPETGVEHPHGCWVCAKFAGGLRGGGAGGAARMGDGRTPVQALCYAPARLALRLRFRIRVPNDETRSCDDTLEAWGAFELARGVPLHDQLARLQRLLKEASQWQG